MPRVSVYLNKEVYERVKTLSKEKGMSLSGYVRRVLTERINGWPEGYFDLVGSLKDDDDPIELPKELPWELNAHRDKLIDEFAEWLDSLPEDLTLPTIPFRSRRSPPEE